MDVNPVRKRRGTNEIVRSALISLGKVNQRKLNILKEIERDGKKITQEYINIFWTKYIKDKHDIRDYNVLLPKDANSSYYNEIQDFKYSARFMQTCASKALSILNPLNKKQNLRRFIYGKLCVEGSSHKGPGEERLKKREKCLQNMQKLRKVYNAVNSHAPVIKHFSLDLNANFVKNNFDGQSKTSFKNWISIAHVFKSYRQVKDKKVINLPIIKTKIFNKFNNNGYILSNFIQITDVGLVRVVFTKKIEKKITGNVCGCDVGAVNVWSLSNGEASANKIHGNKTHNLRDICVSLKKKMKESIGKQKRRTMRDQFVNWSINQIDLTNIKTLKIENLKNMKFGRRTSQMLTAWKGTYIIHKIENKCAELGITVIKVNPKYTSQRCSSCGWVCRKSRNDKLYSCVKCQFEMDADINAANNILYLNEKDNIVGNNVSGFYYNHTD